jgi:hypothetical protein
MGLIPPRFSPPIQPNSVEDFLVPISADCAGFDGYTGS